MLKVKVGHINFLNILPLTYSYKHENFDDFKIFYDVPSVLNNAVKNAQLDISQISSIEYARQNENLLLLPNISIRADCDVESIVLISKKPIEKISDDKITLTSKSATSHCLLKIILAESYGANPKYEIAKVEVKNPIPNDSAASLLIGDDALEIFMNKPKNLFCYDIGKEWHKLTGRSMVFAVWIVRKNFAENFPDILKFAYDKIIFGMKSGIKNKNLAIESVLTVKPFDYDCLNKYLGEIIKWDLPNDAIESLKIFYEKAYKFNLIERLPEIKFASV